MEIKQTQRILFFCQGAKIELEVKFMKFIKELVQLHERENMKFGCFNYMPNLVLLQYFFLIKIFNGYITQKYLAY